jgi:molybdate transport system ATP-binding protein
MVQDPIAVLLELRAVTVLRGGTRALDNLQLTIRKGEQWAIAGPSGSGKTTLAEVLAGQVFFAGECFTHFEGSVQLVSQQHRFKNLSNTNNFYYQQRFNASESEDSCTVRDVLEGPDDPEGWIELLHLPPLMDEPLLQLSNGENKRLQIAKALLQSPALLVLDNPFLGLDVEGRATLNGALNLICKKGIHVVITVTTGDLPDCITHVALLENGRLQQQLKRADYLQLHQAAEVVSIQLPSYLVRNRTATAYSSIIRMENVSVRYGEKLILDRINWEVKPGECWNISGPNGAGKSTLLSLVTADNPQAYSNTIYLFDRKRGSGESIWEIKSKMGFVSPELHLYFDQTSTCADVIASGLFDTIGLFRRLSAEQEDMVEQWLHTLGLTGARDKRLAGLPAGQQRLTLLARALIKNPPLLVLDEPAQGLDATQVKGFLALVDEICRSCGTTLLYVSHYSNEMPSVVQHYLRLDKGKRVEG